MGKPPGLAAAVDKRDDPWRSDTVIQGNYQPGKLFMTSVRSRLIHAAAGALLFCSAGMAAAQYLWVDAKGIKQFSDQPPPPSIPLKNILKAPKGQPSAATAAAEAPAGADAPAAPAAKAPPTLAQRELDFQKRKMRRTSKRKKTATTVPA